MDKKGKVSTSLFLGVMLLALVGAVLVGEKGETGPLFTGEAVEIHIESGGFLGFIFAAVAFLLLIVLGYAVLVYDSKSPVRGLAQLDEEIADIQKRLGNLR